MGLFDAFTKKGRKSRAVEKRIRTVCNKRAADEDRYAAYEALAEEGTDEAIYGLLLRFTYVKEIGQRSRSTDEEDKKYVHDLVVNKGEVALAPLHRFLLAREGPVGAPKHTISWALRILERIVPGPEKHWEIIKEILDDNEPGYERDSSRKTELLTYLGGTDRFDTAAVSEAIVGYLDDQDEEVRFAAADTLLKLAHEGSKKQLNRILEDTDESLQQRSLILSGFIGAGWLDEASGHMPNMPEPALRAAVEALEQLDERYRAQQKIELGEKSEAEDRKDERYKGWMARRAKVRDLMLSAVEAGRSTDEVKSQAAEFMVASGMSVQGARGRVEKALPKGYKVRRQKVERVPEGMREPYLTLCAQRLLDRVKSAEEAAEDQGERDRASEQGRNKELEALVKIVRSNHALDETRARIVEYFASSGVSLTGLEKQVARVLPSGYRLSSDARVMREYSKMDEPFLTEAADDLLDPFLSEPPDDQTEARECIPDDVREALIEMVCNQRTDERTVDRILDRFAAYGWSVRDFERKLERHLPDEFRLSAPRGGLPPKIIKVSVRI